MSLKSTVTDILKLQDSKSRNGIWDGEVVSVEDPSRAGRVRVRIHLIHGVPEETPDTALPWADVNYWGGGHDWGEFDPPVVGTMVHLAFKMGDENMPIVVGCVRGKPTDPQYMRTKKPAGDTVPQWVTPAKTDETPKDIWKDEEEGQLHPHRKIWRKSFKGHTILVEEKDGDEFLKIIDRSGQVIEMACPVTVEENKTVFAQRGTADAGLDTQFDQDRLVDSSGWIRLVDIAGQEVLLDGSAGNETIRLTNQNRSGSKIQTITMFNRAGREYVEIKDKNNNQVRLASNEEYALLLQDQKGSRIGFDSRNGRIVLQPTIDLVESVGKNKSVTVNSNLTEDIAGDRESSVLNNTKISSGNDTIMSTVGSTTVSAGGSIELISAGIPVTEIPPTPHIPGQKSISMTAALGDLQGGALAGNVVLWSVDPTGLTNGLMLAPTGTNSLSALARLALGDVAATDQLVKGTTFIANLTTFISTLIGAATAASVPDPSGVAPASAFATINAAANAFVATLPASLSPKVWTI